MLKYLNEYFQTVSNNGFLKTFFSDFDKILNYPEPVRYVIFAVSSTPTRRISKLTTNKNFRILWIYYLRNYDHKFLLMDKLPSDIVDFILSQKFRENFWAAIFRRYILSFSVYRKWHSVWKKYMYLDFKSAYECFEYFYIYNMCYPSNSIIELLKLIKYQYGSYIYMVESCNRLIRNMIKAILHNDMKLIEEVKNKYDFNYDNIFANYYCKLLEFLIVNNLVDINKIIIPEFINNIGYSKEIISILMNKDKLS